MYKNIFLSLSVFLIFFGCAGSKTKPLTNKDLPDWYLSPPKFEDKFVGVGDALRPQFSLSKQVATERARVEVARAVETTVTSALNDHMQASGMGDEAGSTEFTESVSKSLVNTTLKGCTIEKTEIFKDRVFVMVTYDANRAREEAKAAARIEAKKEEALYNEFKARQAFDTLDQAMDRMKGSSSVADPE
ncbi:MAG: hypothetical protein ACJZ12_00665 [Candidatus Neomarinimicrobiota bacterium]